jgi:hypothetical protein
LKVEAQAYDREAGSGPQDGAAWAYVACRARYLASQLDADKRAKEQALRDAAAKAERDRIAREQAERARLAQLERDRLAQLERERLERERQLREDMEQERLRLEREAQAERERQAHDEEERLAAERARREEEARRKKADDDRKPFVARIVNECVSLVSDNGYGGFHNSCNFPIYVAFCTFMPKEGAASSYFDCDKNKGGLEDIEANGYQAAHTNFAQRVFFFACNAPSTPKVDYHAGAGFFGTCQ